MQSPLVKITYQVLVKYNKTISYVLEGLNNDKSLAGE